MSALRRKSEWLKRALDVMVSLPALVVTAPVIAGLAVAVKLESPGPAFYLQTRVGRGRRPIRVAKLRSMVEGAERSGPHVTAAGDRRITRVGAFLRATKLDELPQLWNVLTGDMSLVGPRPEAERYVAAYRPEWEPLFSVRPGITDVASLVFRNEEELLAQARDRERAYVEAVLPAKLGLALEGVERGSFLNDVVVLARTAAAVLRLRSYEGHPAFEAARRAIANLNQDDEEDPA